MTFALLALGVVAVAPIVVATAINYRRRCLRRSFERWQRIDDQQKRLQNPKRMPE